LPWVKFASPAEVSAPVVDASGVLLDTVCASGASTDDAASDSVVLDCGSSAPHATDPSSTNVSQ
jgi:hypothetical protein